MKNLLKTLGVAIVVLIGAISFASCSKNDDPADNDFFAGTYKGKIGYSDYNNAVQVDGSVFVTKIASGTKYNFDFSDKNIPDLNGIEFEKKGDNVLVSVNSTAASYIRIDNNQLSILYIQNGKTWTASCTR